MNNAKKYPCFAKIFIAQKWPNIYLRTHCIWSSPMSEQSTVPPRTRGTESLSKIFSLMFFMDFTELQLCQLSLILCQKIIYFLKFLLLCDSNFRQTKIYQFNGRARIHGYTLVHTLRLSKSGLWPACWSTRQQQTRPSSLPSRTIPLASNKQNFLNTLWIKDMDRIQLGQALPCTMFYLPGITGRTDHPLSTPDPANLKRKRLVKTKDLIWAQQKRVIQKCEKRGDNNNVDNIFAKELQTVRGWHLCLCLCLPKRW